MDIEELIGSLDPSNPAQVKALQQALQVKGYDVTPDGKMGSKTSQAIGKYRSDQNEAANRGLQTRQLENQAADKTWQNQLRQAAPWLTIPLGMGYGARKAGQIEGRQLATEAAQRAGLLPNPAQNWGPVRRFMGRMAPYAGPGMAFAGEGLALRALAPQIPSDVGKDIARAAGTGLVGASIGVTGKGVINAFTPQVAGFKPPLPSPMGAPNLPQGPGGPGLPPPGAGPMGAEPPALPPPPDTPPPAGPPLRRPSDRLISAARAAGASSDITKAEAADHLMAEGNITPANRTAVAAELGVKSGPNYASRIADRIKLLKTSRTPLAIVAGTGALAYDMGQNEAEAAGMEPGEARVQGAKDAAVAAGSAGGAMYGLSKLGPLARAVAGEGMAAANIPSAIDAMTDYGPDELAMARNWAARRLPEWMRAGAVEDAYSMAQVPQRNPLRAPMGAGGNLPVGPGLPRPPY